MESELEGVELEVVSKLPSEGAEVLELPLEEVLGKALGWKEHAAVLEIARRGFSLLISHKSQRELEQDILSMAFSK